MTVPRRVVVAGLTIGLLGVVALATDGWPWLRNSLQNSATTAVTAPNALTAWVTSTARGARTVRELGELQTQLAARESSAARVHVLELENAELRSLAQLPAPVGYRALGVEIIGRRSDERGITYLINRGQRDGIVRGQPVVVGITDNNSTNQAGMIIGVVSEVADTTANFSATTSPFTTLAAEILGRERVHVLAQGEFNLAIRLQLLPDGVNTQQGDLVVTSNLAEGIPAGLLIGSLSSVERETGELFSTAIVVPPLAPERFKFAAVLSPL